MDADPCVFILQPLYDLPLDVIGIWNNAKLVNDGLPYGC